jgi:hypothetical protein
MTIHEQQLLKERYYSEAIRYMDNAKESLRNAKKEGKFYRDSKYVRTACGTAYNGVLIALDGYFLLKGVEKPKGKNRKSIEYYHNQLGMLDRKLLDYLNSAYKILHLFGYYDGIENANVVKEGFDIASTIIEKIRPT